MIRRGKRKVYTKKKYKLIILGSKSWRMLGIRRKKRNNLMSLKLVRILRGRKILWKKNKKEFKSRNNIWSKNNKGYKRRKTVSKKI